MERAEDGTSPTTLDLTLFAQLTLLRSISLPNPLLQNLIKTSFPALEAHHDRVLSVLFPESPAWSGIPRAPQPAPTQTGIWDSAVSWWAGPRTGRSGKSKDEGDEAFIRARWLWYAGAAGAMVTYLWSTGIVNAKSFDGWVGGGEEEDDEDDDEDVA